MNLLEKQVLYRCLISEKEDLQDVLNDGDVDVIQIKKQLDIIDSFFEKFELNKMRVINKFTGEVRETELSSKGLEALYEVLEREVLSYSNNSLFNGRKIKEDIVIESCNESFKFLLEKRLNKLVNNK